MIESTFTSYTTGDTVRQILDADGALIVQECISCHEERPAVKFPKRSVSPTGRALRCYRCRRRAWNARRRAEIAAQAAAPASEAA